MTMQHSAETRQTYRGRIRHHESPSTKQAGKHFDPRLVALLEQHMPAILEIKERWAEH